MVERCKEVGNMVLEGFAYLYLGETLMLSGSLDEAVAHFKFSVETFDTIRGSFISSGSAVNGTRFVGSSH